MRNVIISLVLMVFSIQHVSAQLNKPVIRTKVLQGQSVSSVSLFSIQNISTVDAFSENMSGEGFNRDLENGQIYHLRYEADQNFEGIDVAIFETTESLFGPKSFVTVEIEVVRSIIDASDDFILSDQLEGVDINVLENDLFSGTSLSVVAIESAFGGSFEYMSDGVVQFVPQEGFIGLASASYIVQDELGTSDMAHIYVQVPGKSVQSVEELNFVHVVSDPLLIHIDSEGFNVSSDSELLFGSISQVGPFSFIYESDLFIEGLESFTLTNENGDIKNIAITLINKYHNQSVLRDDNAYTVPGKYVFIDALANDYSNNAVMVDHSDELLYSSGIFVYIPNEDFEGVKEFYYTVHDGFKTHTASINVYVGNYLPRVKDYVFQAYEGTPLAIEYNVPINAYEFTIIDEPISGDLKINASRVDDPCATAVGNKMLVYTPDQSFIGVDQFSVQYCSDAGACETVQIAVNVIANEDDCACVGPACVWPGDTNHDGVVNVGDLLPIGLNYGLSGHQRQDNGAWGAQMSDQWSIDQNDGSNANHIDSDGDGLISVADTAAIAAHYGNQDNLIANQTLIDKSIPISLIPSSKNPSNGDLLHIDIHVGSEEYPVIDLQGLATSIQIPASLISDSTSVEFVPNREWFGANSPVVAMSFVDASGQVDIGIIRTNFIGISGSGSIGSLSIATSVNVDELLPKNPELPLKIVSHKSYMMDGRGTPVEIDGTEVELTVQLRNQDLLDQNQGVNNIDIQISPNPSDGPITIHANDNDELIEVTIYDLMGQKMIEHSNLQSNHLVINQSLTQGLYLAHIKTQKGFIVQQMEVIR